MKRGLRYVIFVVPVLLMVGFLGILWAGLGHNPSIVPSPLIGKSAPTLILPRLRHPAQMVNRSYFLGHVTLLNVWASWCISCRYEHPTLLWLKRKGVRILGVDYKDKRTAALDYLRKNGNPYQEVVFDRRGLTTINWGVYGTPETFVVGPHAIIRYKYVGPISLRVARRVIYPLVRRLDSDGPST
ncbi:MAG: DsbE family thiol:disulfide interchange protein [Gammaproteobacteria bacterium]